MPHTLTVDVRLNVLGEILLAPWQMRSDLANDHQPDVGSFSDADGLGNTFPRCHSPNNDKKILRLIIEWNCLKVDPVINDWQGFVPQHFGLRPADANRKTAGEVIPIVIMKPFLNVRIGNQSGRL